MISGSVFESDGMTLLQGANVIGRNTADPFFNAVSAVSGYLFFPGGLGPGPTPPALEVSYDLRGLPPGASYTVEKTEINPLFTGGSSVGPVDPPIELPIEEFYDAAEAGADPPDDPTVSTPVVAPAMAIDIICNFSPLVPLGDDDFVEVALPFALNFCGTDYTSVFVGSNGFLTFGTGDTDLSESVQKRN